MSNSPEASKSRKEEILAMGRRSKKDEGLEHAKLKGFSAMEITFSIAGLFVALFSFFTKDYTTFWAVVSIAFAAVFGQYIPIYRFTKRKLHMVFMVLSLMAAIASLLAFVAVSRGWIEPTALGKWWGH